MKTFTLSLLVVSVLFGSKAEYFKNVFFDRLELLMDYCIAHPETVDSGTMLGVLFAKGRLEWHPERQNVVQLIRKSVALEKSFLEKLETPTIANKIVHELMKLKLNLKFPIRNLKQLFVANPEFATLSRYTRILNDDRNLPNGLLSDRCLLEVLKGCHVSEDCYEIEDPRSASFGYSQTHKLIFHLFNLKKCGNVNFIKFSNKMCSEIFHESFFIVDRTSELPELKDLLMEQLFVCTLAGFSDFFNNHWIADLLTWQQMSGCFSYDNFNCSSHMNGLAAANLAVFGTTLDSERF